MKYMLFLPVFSYVSAFNLSREQSQCIERCNQLPFKVAAKKRRADCVDTCATKVQVGAVSQSAEGRDPSCVENCNERKGSRRYKSSCAMRCPQSSEGQIESIDTIAPALERQNDKVSVDDASISIKFDLVSHLPLEELAHNTSSTGVIETKVKNATSSVVNLNNTTVKDNSNTSEVMDSTPELKMNMASANDIMPESNEDKHDVESNVTDPDTSITITGEHKASVELSSLPNTSEASSINEAMSGSKDETHENVTNETANADLGNSTVFSQWTSDAVQNQTNSSSDPAYASAQEAELKPDQSLDPSLIKNNTRSLNEPSAAPDAAPVSFIQEASPIRNETQSVNFVLQDDCIAKCNEKRTLKRKKDACLKRCGSHGSSILSRGYGSVKFEL